MKLPPYDKFPEIISAAIVLRQVQVEHIKDLVVISFYDSRQALSAEDAIDMHHKINRDYQKVPPYIGALLKKPQIKLLGQPDIIAGLKRALENWVAF